MLNKSVAISDLESGIGPVLHENEVPGRFPPQVVDGRQPRLGTGHFQQGKAHGDQVVGELEKKGEKNENWEKPPQKSCTKSAADVKMVIPVLVRSLQSSILSSTSLQKDKTF